jgi:hypothetical protein
MRWPRDEAGQLLAERQMAKGTRGQVAGGQIIRPPDVETLSDLYISKDQSSR